MYEQVKKRDGVIRVRVIKRPKATVYIKPRFGSQELITKPTRGVHPNSGTNGIEEVTVKWSGKTDCDFCGKDVRKFPVFYDARTIYGSWALMCPTCFARHSAQKIGIGWGQKYSGKTLEKIAG